MLIFARKILLILTVEYFNDIMECEKSIDSKQCDYEYEYVDSYIMVIYKVNVACEVYLVF